MRLWGRLEKNRLRKYFWKKDKITLKAYRENCGYNVEKELDEEDICLMIHNGEDVCVGYIVLDWMNERAGSTGIYVEIDQRYRRKGYGTSAMEIMMEYAFQERRFHKLQCCTKSNEEGVESFLYQLGFLFEAVRTNMFIIEGKKVSEYYYGITESEYRNPKRNELHHKQAPNQYMTPLRCVCDEIESKNLQAFSKVEYEKKDQCYYCNGLKFRAMTVQDYRINNDIIYDSQVCRWYDDDVKIPGLTDNVDEFQLAHLDYKMEDGRLEFAIEEDGEYLGCVNLCGIDTDNERVSASIYLRPEVRRKGCGTKAIQFALSYAARELQCHMFTSCVSDGNIASAKMMRKLGCRFGGVQREAAFVGGKYVDTLFFECVIG